MLTALMQRLQAVTALGTHAASSMQRQRQGGSQLSAWPVLTKLGPRRERMERSWRARRGAFDSRLPEA